MISHTEIGTFFRAMELFHVDFGVLLVYRGCEQSFVRGSLEHGRIRIPFDQIRVYETKRRRTVPEPLVRHAIDLWIKCVSEVCIDHR